MYDRPYVMYFTHPVTVIWSKTVECYVYSPVGPDLSRTPPIMNCTNHNREAGVSPVMLSVAKHLRRGTHRCFATLSMTGPELLCMPDLMVKIHYRPLEPDYLSTSTIFVSQKDTHNAYT